MTGRQWSVSSALAVALALAGGAARAEDEPVVERLQHGEVNWTTKTVLATGSGAADLKQPNVAAARLGAERAAKLDAYRNVLEALGGVRLGGPPPASPPLGNPQIRAQVEGLVSGCKTVDTRYYSDGGVDVVVRCPLDGGIAAVLAPAPTPRKVPPTAGEARFSGLVVDASGTRAPPALSPRLLDARGRVLYGAEVVTPSALRAAGAANYARTVDAALRDPRAGKTPLVVKVARVGANPGDLELVPDDVTKLDGLNQSFLADGRVVIVTDGP